ncbi:PspC domain-containing protein [Amycolatopsis marina]|uniref:PspC domain-containing protein n=1 Tax=Amycolatopsis marina TaxID=490629 RepID=UPI000B8747E1|nr:PspC domain-containing protein [Amycolatopsis marina]
MTTSTRSLTRPRGKRVFGGVCAGLAERVGWKPRNMRLLFVLSCLLPGPQVLLYVALWIIMPDRGY